jgi:hypothetical protein
MKKCKTQNCENSIEGRHGSTKYCVPCGNIRNARRLAAKNKVGYRDAPVYWFRFKVPHFLRTEPYGNDTTPICEPIRTKDGGKIKKKGHD